MSSRHLTMRGASWCMPRGLRFGAGLAAGCALACVAACAPQSEPSLRDQLCAGGVCTPECRDLQVSLCDIQERACQETIFKSVRCVRGSALTELPRTAFAPPETSDAAPEAVVDAGPPEELTPTEIADQVWSQYLDSGLRALHLIEQPLAAAIAEANQVTGGIASDGGVQILPGNAEAKWWSMHLLAHEYVHTMQERDYGGIASLYAKYSRSSVTAQGIQAYIEGEADMYAWLTHAFMRNAPMDAWGLEEYFSLDERGARDRALGATSPWTVIRQWQHYAIGARHLYRAWRVGQNIGVRSVLYNLEPDFGRWAADFATPTGPRVSEHPVCEPEHAAIIVQDALGPSGVYAVLIAALRAQKPAVMPSEHMWRVAKDLTQDQVRMYAYTFGTGATQAQWLERQSRHAMCPISSSAPPKVNDAGPTESVTATSTSDARVSPALDANTPESSTLTSDVGSSAAATSAPAVACDAGAGSAGLPTDAGWFETDDDTTFAELQQHLVPGGPVWASWALGFETKDSADQFAAWIEAADWDTLRVEHSGRSVTLFTRDAPKSDAERAAFDAWTCP